MTLTTERNVCLFCITNYATQKGGGEFTTTQLPDTEHAVCECGRPAPYRMTATIGTVRP